MPGRFTWRTSCPLRASQVTTDADVIAAATATFLDPHVSIGRARAEIWAARGQIRQALAQLPGVARTGTLYAYEQYGILPDILATAKGIGGGFPLAAIAGRADIMAHFDKGAVGVRGTDDIPARDARGSAGTRCPGRRRTSGPWPSPAPR